MIDGYSVVFLLKKWLLGCLFVFVCERKNERVGIILLDACHCTRPEPMTWNSEEYVDDATLVEQFLGKSHKDAKFVGVIFTVHRFSPFSHNFLHFWTRSAAHDIFL